MRLTPVIIENRPGQSALFYRVGTYGQFKSSMHASIGASQSALAHLLTTRADDDLSIALIDAWATVADVLTFYQERIANEGYLRTATERRFILELAREVGYELQPGVAAGTFLAFTLEDSPGSMEKTTIDIGTKVQSLPAQGQMPQVFETIERLEAFSKWNNLKPRLFTHIQEELVGSLKEKKETLPPLFFKGTNTRLKPGDGLLFVNNDDPIAFKIVTTVQPDPLLQRTTVNVLPASALNLINGYEIQSITAKHKGDQIPPLSGSSLSASAKSTQFSLPAILARPWTESDLKAYVIMNNWSMTDLVKAVNQNNEQKASPKDELISVYAFRVRANLFGHNAPLWTILPASYRFIQPAR